jgi:Tfp pilus assembly protein PilV
VKASGKPNTAGFSLAELLLSLGFITTVVLIVMGLTTTLHRSGQESADRVTAATIAETEIQRAINAGQSDNSFWAADHTGPPYSSGAVTIKGTDFDYVVTAVTVMDGGVPVGHGTGLTENRLKKVDIIVTWWESATTERAGYGKLEFKASRLVSEVNE